MALDFDMQEKTICGYHKRNTNKFGILENKFPIFQDENDSIFLLTRDHFFSISTPQITSVIKNYLRYKKFGDIKRIVANILVLPGVFIALASILKYADLLDQFESITEILESKLVNVLFGISIFNVIILWHDFYEEKSHPIQLPKAKKIQQKEIDEIKATGFKFGRYGHLDTVSFASEQTLELLCNFTKDNQFQTYDLFKYLLKEDYDIQQIVRRSGIEMSVNEMEEKFKIGEDVIPDYPITALRSILTYAIEEAILTESRQLEPQHIFLAILRLYPQTLKYIQAKGISIDILREISLYNNSLIAKAQRTKHLDPNIPYFNKGGIARRWIYGYTFILGHFSKDLTEEVANNRDIYGIGHDE